MLKVFSNYVLLQTIEEKQVSPIEIPEHLREKDCRGVVAFINPDYWRCDDSLMVGDVALFIPGSGITLKIGDEEYVLVKSENIYAKEVHRHDD